MNSVANMNRISVVKNILSANDRIAEENRDRFSRSGVTAINIMSSPGSGKTSLLEVTIPRLQNMGINVGVIVGDIMTTSDAERIAKCHVPVVQIMTEPFGGACHLDAGMIREALLQLNLDDIDILIIENVGNLVCPAEFDIGQHERVILLSITEGEDKPIKYPLVFRISDLLVLNKTDLMPYLNFDMELLLENVRRVNSHLNVFAVSATEEKNLDAWIHWLEMKINKYKIPV